MRARIKFNLLQNGCDQNNGNLISGETKKTQLRHIFVSLKRKEN